MTAEERIARGRRVKELLDDEVFTDALEAVKARIRGEWEAAEEPRLREAAWYKMKALPYLVEQLRRIINDGEHAQRALEKHSG